MQNDDKNYVARGFFDDLDLGNKEVCIITESEEIANVPECPAELGFGSDESESDEDSSQENESEQSVKENDGIVVSKSKLALIKNMILNLREASLQLETVLSGVLPSEEYNNLTISQIGEESISITNEEDAKIIEGVFDGEKMIGPDGKQYSVPANYASKSKMVEGDILKLTITDRGSFVYKQIGPIERVRQVGILECHDGNFLVSSENKKWQILPASVTYFKGQSGDEVVLLIPKAGESKWGAVENIIRNKESTNF